MTHTVFRSVSEAQFVAIARAHEQLARGLAFTMWLAVVPDHVLEQARKTLAWAERSGRSR